MPPSTAALYLHTSTDFACMLATFCVPELFVNKFILLIIEPSAERPGIEAIVGVLSFVLLFLRKLNRYPGVVRNRSETGQK